MSVTYNLTSCVQYDALAKQQCSLVITYVLFFRKSINLLDGYRRIQMRDDVVLTCIKYPTLTHKRMLHSSSGGSW